MQKAFSVAEVLRQQKRTFDNVGRFERLFGHPERSGVWFIWGQSGNGKSSFVMQLCKALLHRDNRATLLYNSLEESTSKTFQDSLIRHGMSEVTGFQVLQPEYLEQLTERLRQPRSPSIIVIDSIQHFMITYREYVMLKEQFPQKLFIFISQADGKNPSGKAAKAVMYDATLKIWVEGYRAFSKGRFFGPDPNDSTFTIWEERASVYWGSTSTNNTKTTEPCNSNQDQTSSDQSTSLSSTSSHDRHVQEEL